MAVLVGDGTKVIVQGITGHQGQFHAKSMREFGTKVVGGVTPGKGGSTVDGIPVFDTVMEAAASTGANATCIFVPAKFAKDAVFEAVNAGIRLIVVITEHIPFLDAMQFTAYAKLKGAVVIGPNCPGVSSPGYGKIGIMPSKIFAKGDVGVISRSGTLTYEIVNALTESGFGETTCVGIGGDPIIGSNFVEILPLLEADEKTKRIVMVGEIGGTAEEEAAAFISSHVSKPVYAYIAGRSAPEGKRMGHAGAIISRGRGTAESKIESLKKAGVTVAALPTDIPGLMKKH
ncbi:MAG: succinate--CoA ligase subunit alpha [Thermoplasmata archaeon]|nr:succinate--CoA ligase subunit alpha [Candidatus Sysuiplasma acidicola]MBX8637435.1 succinate--CoA ligase subunit alpha [Candidatus Sysuiplasma acidicola]MBX8645653.1 succinate--CoA ligase subunit alpha [Candidatus Sysuiplasma acidicola]MDH2905165.1 succinate--CoA ligase subunit alpha [Methanomassiliicoccales archaeon]